jgi:hypothetical protein
MTVELLAMNKSAVALAADSAIMVKVKSRTRNRNKIYNTADKLFSLSMQCPVGIMIYDNGELNGLPWETIIKIYKNTFFHPEQETLKDYANDFIKFLCDIDSTTQRTLFPKKQQERTFGLLIGNLFTQISEDIEKAIKHAAKSQDDLKRDEIALDVIKAYFEDIQSASLLDECSESFGTQVFDDFLSNHPDIVSKIKKGPLALYSLPKEADEYLFKILNNLACKDRFVIPSGIVIAGFGYQEVFPSYMNITIDGVFNDKLKYKINDFIDINYDRKAHIMPFGESDFIETFLLGIEPTYRDMIKGLMEDFLIKRIPNEIIGKITDLDKIRVEAIKNDLELIGRDKYDKFWKYYQEHGSEYFSEPVLLALESLPKDEMTILAESLVNLASARKRMSLEEETIGGPCDVAIISKGDGFIWIKRKRYFKPEINPQFISRYFRANRNRRKEELYGMGNM